jgi:enoyl-CoA hydratase/carnithine racemase
VRGSTIGAPPGARCTRTGFAVEHLGVLSDEPVRIVEIDPARAPADLSAAVHPMLPQVVVGRCTGAARSPAPVGLDVAIATDARSPSAFGWVQVDDADEAVASLAAAAAAAPHAAVVLCQVLRAGTATDIDGALLIESLAYSTLQSGPDFSRWLATVSPPAAKPEPTDAVLVHRRGGTLDITLNRPASRNALNARMRDELVAALRLAAADDTITSVHLRGNGPTFCSGGDLAEFGTRRDPSTAHLVRVARSPASVLASLTERSTAHLHGACVGAGIELAAFCRRVVAAPDTWVQLPEVGLGLIPGAGGTVSIPRRIGRQRAAWLGLSGQAVGAALAAQWGLIDTVGTTTGTGGEGEV